MTKHLDEKTIETARRWMGEEFDEETRKQVMHMMDNDILELNDAFYRNLEFGTGGLRGIMGAGTNRINKYTIAMATQGLANYLKKMFSDEKQIKAAIAYDSRNNSKFFSDVCAEILSANGIKVYVYESLRPTPSLSFAIRHLGCHSGIVITASHNPKEYNGYKVYWDDGAQLVAPHDKNVIEEVLKIKSVNDVNFKAESSLIEIIGEEVDTAYFEKLMKLRLNPEIIREYEDLPIVFTPLHGTGVYLIPEALRRFGFKNVISVAEQSLTDGNFPSVHSPNPEEPAALELAVELAKKVGAGLVMATDPDADRVGIAVPDKNGEFVLLNGNQTASILIYYILNEWEKQDRLSGKEYIVKTIVTSELLKKIAEDKGVECFDVLTGFKFIADIIRKLEGEKIFIAGGEESYGYLIGDFVRDKDAISSCCLIAEALAWAKGKGMSILDLLAEIYYRYGFYKESLASVTRKGKAGAEEIGQMMHDFRNKPPKEIGGAKVSCIKDYLLSKEMNISEKSTKEIKLPKSDVIQFILEDESIITVRPSGTEPKIKFYFGVKGELTNKADYKTLDKELQNKLDKMKKFLEV